MSSFYLPLTGREAILANIRAGDIARANDVFDRVLAATGNREAADDAYTALLGELKATEDERADQQYQPD